MVEKWQLFLLVGSSNRNALTRTLLNLTFALQVHGQGVLQPPCLLIIQRFTWMVTKNWCTFLYTPTQSADWVTPNKARLKKSKVSYYHLRERKRLFLFFFLFIIFLCLFSLVQIISCDVSAYWEKLLLSLSFCVIMVRDGHSYFKHTGLNVENCKRNPLKLPESRLEGSPM